MTVSELDDLLAFRNLREPYFRMSAQGRPLHEKRYLKTLEVQGTVLRGVVDADKVAAEFAHGATLLLDSMNHYHSPIRALCDRLREELGAPTEAVGFVTPPNSEGLTPHQDNTEVFVLQIHGRKSWKVYPQIRPLVQQGEVFTPSALGEPVLDVVLEPGDFLYIPWGSPHAAVAGDDVSVHLSVMLRPPTWATIAQELIKTALAELPFAPIPLAAQGLRDPDATAVHAVLDAALQPSRVSEMFQDYVRAVRGVPARRAGFLQQVGRLGDLESGTMLRVDQRVPYEIVEAADVRVVTDGRAYRYPAEALPALRLIEASERPFPISALTGVCPPNLVRSIVRNLVVNGVLTIV
ncbi:cupin domain-containing protein [Kribbella sp. NPDC020789]